MYKTLGETDTRAFGEALGRCLRAGDTVLLAGELGAGKSVLARGVARALGVACPMQSPSFPIMIPYEGREKVYHFDLYRVADEDELYALGLYDELGGDGVALVEWPFDRLAPVPYVRLRLWGDGETRRIAYEAEGLGAREAGVLDALAPWRCAEEVAP